MKHPLIALGLLAATFCFSVPARADDTACEALAMSKNLAGAAKTSFMKKCAADMPSAVASPGVPASAAAPAPTATLISACEGQAVDKRLAGAAKTSFVRKCEKDASPVAAARHCETQAHDRKLAGAAHDSFVKKCVADATPR